MPDADLPATRANESAQHPALSSLLQMIRARTPARLLVGRSGPAYRTATQLELRQDHAVALDAVHAEVDLIRDFGGEFVNRWELFEIQTQARDKLEYLMRPDLGRRLNASARETLSSRLITVMRSSNEATSRTRSVVAGGRIWGAPRPTITQWPCVPNERMVSMRCRT